MSVINETVTPSIALVSSSGIICYGTEVRFTATTVNGGNNSRYQWKLNGTGVGSNSPVYITNTLNDGVTVSLITDICMLLEVTTDTVAQAAFDVMSKLTISELTKELLVYTGEFTPTFNPFTCH